MEIVVAIVAVVLVLGLIGFLNIFFGTADGKTPNPTLDKVTRPFLLPTMLIVGLVLFLIFWAVMARLTPPEGY
jgi:tryptophan-rich sensory protein